MKAYLDSPILKDAAICQSFFKRLAGFMFRRNLRPGEAIFFPNCWAIHTFFVKKPLRIVFLDREMNTLREIKRLKAWRFAYLPGAKHVLEIVC